MWELAVDLRWINSAFVVSPSKIVTTAIDLLRSGELLDHISITLARMFAGFFAGSVAGLLLGLVMGWSKTVRAVFNPIVSVIYPMPKIALLPLIMLLIGIGEAPIILIVTLGAFFPVLVNTIAGVANIDPIFLDAAKNYGVGRFKTFSRVLLPGSLPMAFAGFRLALGIALLLTVVVELSIATKGLGAMLWLSWETLRVDRIYVAIAAIAALASILKPLLELTRRRLTPWQEAH